ncbi:hypothetical protein BN2476_620031 [Paraburkholderia piptadeniae]|uniref:Uncharacterized protein n=1 Tax=Paraburkholderia piptadeniae TaxID=1701573 RepID=A0A1N7SKW0_9BURK|nr:hypothetical protein BN2476_620031 [Paraburkholderia piptadeniae]
MWANERGMSCTVVPASLAHFADRVSESAAFCLCKDVSQFVGKKKLRILNVIGRTTDADTYFKSHRLSLYFGGCLYFAKHRLSRQYYVLTH